MLEKLIALLGNPFNTTDDGVAYYAIPGEQREQVLEILGISEEDVDTSGGTAETLAIENRDEVKIAQIVGSPNVDTGHAPIWYATEEIPLS